MDVRPLLPFTIAELKRRLGRKSYARLHEYVSGKEECPAEVCIAIEEATGGAVPREAINPRLFVRGHVSTSLPKTA